MPRSLPIFLALMILMPGTRIYGSPRKTCEKMDFTQWTANSKRWQGRELVAFASWCSSCKDKVFAARAAPDKYVLISVFEDVEASDNVLHKLNADVECIYGDELAVKLGVHSLPWSKKI